MSSSKVNRPTDVAARNDDINRKLQLYGIVTAFKSGKLPSNDQIDIAMNSFVEQRFMHQPSSRLSPEGRALVLSLRQLVQEAQYLFLTKNEGNLLQDFIWQAGQVEGDIAAPRAPVDGADARQHGDQALDGFRTLGTLLVTNGQFRKLLSDATLLIRDMAGDAASKAANTVKPSDEQLAQIDKPAASDTWHDEPDLSSANLKTQVKSAFDKNKPVSGDDLRDATGAASSSAHPAGSSDPADTAAIVREQGASGVDAIAGVQAGAATLQQRASENIPQETREQASARKEQAQEYFSKKMPQERRDQTIWRLRKMVVEIQGHPDYERAINTLLSLAETYAGHASNMGKQSTASARDLHTDHSLKAAEKDLKLLIERFANSTSSDDLFDAINAVYRDAEKDPELRSWFKHLNVYIRKCLKQRGFIMEESATDEWNQIYDRGEFLLRERYRNHTDRIADEVKFLGSQFDQDPLNKHFGQSLKKFFKDLGNDENGKPTFKPHLVKDLTEVIIPGALRGLHYVPVPRIEYSDSAYDAVIENLIIESDNLMPNIVEIANDNYIRFGRREIANKNANSVSVHVSGIQMDLRDVSYYVRRKEGSLKFTDNGIMDIFLGGSGFSFKMKMSNAQKNDRQHFFKVEHVDVDVKNFNIKLKDSKYRFLFRLAKPVMLRLLRPMLQKVLQKQIKDQFNQIDNQAYLIKQEADRAKREVRENPENAPNIYQRYVNAAQKMLLQGKKKSEEVVADKKLNMAVTKQDSMFPQISLPGGISTKATEYRELGMSGELWESPIFKLGSSLPTTGIPHPAKVERKDHAVTQGGVRESPTVNGRAGVNGSAGVNGRAAATGPTTTSAATRFPIAEMSQRDIDVAFNREAAEAVRASKALDNASNGRTLLGSNNPVLRGDV